MITKEQALQLKHGDVITRVAETIKLRKWRVNGKIKTWKREAERFQLPIKHGLYDYAYLTNDNCHLFQLID